MTFTIANRQEGIDWRSIDKLVYLVTDVGAEITDNLAAHQEKKEKQNNM